MNFIFNLIVAGFVINLNIGFPFSSSDPSNEIDERDFLLKSIRPIRPIDGVWVNRSKASQMSSMDVFHFHHAFTVQDMTWRDGQVNFEIDEAFDEFERTALMAAMEEIQDSTCIRFVQSDNRHKHFVKILKDFENEDRADSLVGCHYIGQQDVFFGYGTLYYSDYEYVIRHQFLHTLGFFNHHMRSDRDEFIEFHMENTNLNDSFIETHFTKILDPDPEVEMLTNFDFYSVMLIDPFYNITTGKAAVTSKIEGMKIPGHNEKPILSKSDKILINKFYNCPDN